MVHQHPAACFCSTQQPLPGRAAPLPWWVLPLLQRSQMDAVLVDEQMLVADNMASDPASAAQGSAPQQLAADNYAPSQEMSLRPASQVGAGS